MASTGITRNPGESEEDFKRRYKREYMHAYYHAKLSRPRKPRGPKAIVGGERAGKKFNITHREGETQEEFAKRYGVERQRILRARGRGEDTEVTGEVLVRKHRQIKGLSDEERAAVLRQPGETFEDWSKRNLSERTKRAKARHPERYKARAKAYYEANPEKEKARRVRYREENPEKVKEGQKRYLEKHPERLASLIKWGKDNPERRAMAVKAWNSQNRALLNAYSAAWRKQARIATPSWSDFEQVKAFYVEAKRLTLETGIIHHVDHIVPLRRNGPYGVCGLHTQRNLRVITGVENVRKQAKIDHDLLQAMWREEVHLFPLPDEQV